MAHRGRLQAQFNPQSYNWRLELDPESKVFRGNVSITGNRRSRPSHRITLHQSGLKITKAKIIKLEKGSQVELTIVRIVHHKKLQEVRLHTLETLHSGSYQLELQYSGHIQISGTTGIYTSYWHAEGEGVAQEIIATQFEPHYARTLLPCVDEPEAKASFDLSLNIPTRHADLQTLFNTEIVASEDAGDQRQIKFKQTPPMSTYLLALIVGKLKYNSKETKDGIELSIYSTPPKINNTKFALEFAEKTINLLQDKFRFPYPLAKLDLVAVPDFETAGMENWGLATFREDLLLFDPDISTLSDKQSIAQVIAHEIAHQWFGNLVTMKWWDELWLNEGFANFMEYYLVDKIFPEWKVLEAYLVYEKSSAIRIDSLPSSRPIVKKVTNLHHAVEAFDSIAYEKSGNIIRMIFQLIGEDSFMKGLNQYFNNYKFSSASSEDLISCWQDFTKLNLLQFVKPWINQPGLPLVSISIGNNPNQIVLSQSRFLSDSKHQLKSKRAIQKELDSALKLKPSLKPKQKEFYLNNLRSRLYKKDSSLWQIPIDFIPEGSSSPQPFLLKKEAHKLQLKKDINLPLKLNKNGGSFYLVSYPLEFLARISVAIKESKLTQLDTLNLICDFISLNRSAQFEPGAGAILDILNSAKNTTNSHFWSLAGSYIGYINYHLKYKEDTRVLTKYIEALIANALSSVSFDASKGESAEMTSTRFELLSLAVLAKHKTISEKFLSTYDSAKELSEIDPEKRLLSFYCVAKRGLQKDYKKLLSDYRHNLEDVNLREDIAYALCLFDSSENVQNNLSLLQDPQLVKTQDILSWISSIMGSSRLSSEICIRWIIKEGGWQWLQKTLGSHDLNSLVMIILSSVFAKAELNRMVKFIEELNNPELLKALSESKDIANSRIHWHKNELPKAVDYLCGW